MHVPRHPCLCMACPVQCILARSKTPCQSPATTGRLSLNRRKRAPNVSHILRKFFGALGNNRAGKWQTHCRQFSNVTIARAELQEQNLETADRGSLAEEVWQGLPDASPHPFGDLAQDPRQLWGRGDRPQQSRAGRGDGQLLCRAKGRRPFKCL